MNGGIGGVLILFPLFALYCALEFGALMALRQRIVGFELALLGAEFVPARFRAVAGVGHRFTLLDYGGVEFAYECQEILPLGLVNAVFREILETNLVIVPVAQEQTQLLLRRVFLGIQLPQPSRRSVAPVPGKVKQHFQGK
jgi:hypothetical protein